MNNRTKLTIRLNKENDDMLKIAAKRCGMSKNEYINFLIKTNFEKSINIVEMQKEQIGAIKEISTQLKKFGNVLNDTNKKFYFSNNNKIKDIDKIMEEIWQYIRVLIK